MTLLKAGDVIEIKEHHKIYAEIDIVYYGGKPVRSVEDVYAASEHGDFTGLYIVNRTEMMGGGTAHGPHDVYPDGHRVFCGRIGDGMQISFYQTGCFTAMIRDIEPIGRTWPQLVL